MSPRFNKSTLTGSARDLHRRPVGDAEVPAWERLFVERRSLVLGSTQRRDRVAEDVAAATRVDIATRNSGGGAVWLDPETSTWVDITIGSQDPRWDADLGRSFHWIGDLFAGALADQGVTARVHTGPFVDRGFARQVCFAGIGPGEVMVGDRKLIGISQRRVRDRARFQMVMYQRWDPAPMSALFGESLSAADLAGLEAMGVGCSDLGVDVDDLLAAVSG